MILFICSLFANAVDYVRRLNSLFLMFNQMHKKFGFDSVFRHHLVHAINGMILKPGNLVFRRVASAGKLSTPSWSSVSLSHSDSRLRLESPRQSLPNQFTHFEISQAAMSETVSSYFFA